MNWMRDFQHEKVMVAPSTLQAYVLRLQQVIASTTVGFQKISDVLIQHDMVQQIRTYKLTQNTDRGPATSMRRFPRFPLPCT